MPCLVYRKRWYLANVKLDMFISILYVNIANLKSVPIEIFAEILKVLVGNIGLEAMKRRRIDV